MKEKQKNSLEVFENAPIGQAVMKNSIPAMLAMLMVLIYNLADTFFIGQTKNALMVASVSLVTLAFLLFMALGTVFGIGGTSVISRAMGEGRREYAKKVCAFCMWSCIAVGIIMAIIIFIFMNQILVILGASENTISYAREYLSIVTIAGPFVLVSNCYANIIRSEGKAGMAIIGQLGGNILNVILDAVLILGFEWNVVGAAIATAVSNMISAAYYIGYFRCGKSMLSIKLKDFSVKDNIFKGVVSIGVPAALGDILMSVSSIILNGQMAQYGDMEVAGIGVAMKITMITGMICIDFGQGIQPLLGYCIGAKNWNRYKDSLRFSVVFGFGLSIIMTVFCYLFGYQIVSIFLSEPEALSYGLKFSRILLTTSFLFGLFYVLSNALQAMGAATAALIINVSRQGLIYIPIIFILKKVLGMYGLIWAQSVADVLSVILVIIIYHITTKSKIKI